MNKKNENSIILKKEYQYSKLTQDEFLVRRMLEHNYELYNTS